MPQCPLCPLCPDIPCVLVPPCPGAPCTPVLQQLLLLQVHLTWFWDNLASNVMSHFPSLLVQGGKVPVGHGSGDVPAQAGLVTAGRSLVVQVGKLRQGQLDLTGLLFSSSPAEGQLS